MVDYGLAQQDPFKLNEIKLGLSSHEPYCYISTLKPISIIISSFQFLIFILRIQSCIQSCKNKILDQVRVLLTLYPR